MLHISEQQLLVVHAHIQGVCVSSQVFLSWGFLSGRFCPVWFLSVPLLSEYVCYNRKLNITLKFRFHMCDKKNYKCDVIGSRPPPTFTNCHTISDPYPSSVTYFMDGPKLVIPLSRPELCMSRKLHKLKRLANNQQISLFVSRNEENKF